MKDFDKSLLETYSKRIDVADKLFESANGCHMDMNRKQALAMVLDNTTKFLNEAFANSVGTQRADLGAWKKFCINLTNVALPTLIAPELVLVNPMSSYSGYVTYVKYTYGSNKGGTKAGTAINTPFALGDVDVNFTSSKIVEPVTLASGEASKEVVLAWTPVVENVFGEGKTVKFIGEDGTVSYLTVTDGKVTVTASGRIAYEYNNEVIPQHDIPTINAEIIDLPLVAKKRGVQVYYSQIAAYQAKQDYGFDLGDQLAEKACGQLAYEIDTEITNLLIANAEENAECVWSKKHLQTISKAQHYEGFAEIVDIAATAVYNKTRRFNPNYMLCARDVINVLNFVPGFKAASTSKINGPFLAGTLNGMKVFVTPNIEKGKFVIGVNGDDFMSSAAVYAPYMAIVPTQLLGFADGAMNQGFSTMYALEMLNKDLLVAGRITETEPTLPVDVIGE